jgi:transcriptional regulator with XRE-family HTH domain
MSRALGLDQGYLSRLVRGESVGSPATIQKIATLTDGAVTFNDMVQANAAAMSKQA